MEMECLNITLCFKLLNFQAYLLKLQREEADIKAKLRKDFAVDSDSS